MLFRLKSVTVLFLVFALSFCFAPFGAYGESSKPRQCFKWVQPHVDSSGHFVPGHWNYIGPPKPGIKWVPGHYDKKGKWTVGKWVPVGQAENRYRDLMEDEDSFGE